MKRPHLLPAIIIALSLASAAAYAAANYVRFSESQDQICISSNGLPDHATGRFPNAGNPHSLQAQRVDVCVARDPAKGDVARDVQTIGIATNGVIIRPGTADYYDPSAPRGHSRNATSGWTLEGMGSAETLGLDQNNAHVDHRGLYHYHGVPETLAGTSAGTLIGYAADGFEIHYVGASAQPSYALLPGTRDSGPGGAHDGTYVEDWEYVSGYGNLDQCNGAEIDGDYYYFATDSYPYFPRCLWGTEITRIR